MVSPASCFKGSVLEQESPGVQRKESTKGRRCRRIDFLIGDKGWNLPKQWGESNWSGDIKHAGRVKGGMVSREQYLIFYPVDKNSYPVIHDLFECRGCLFNLYV